MLCKRLRPKKYFFRNKTFLFFKIESWNFQHLFEKEFRETSQNFNSIRQPIEKMKITIVWISWMSWNFVRFHKIQFQTDAESFSLKNKKVLFLKKYLLSRTAKKDPKDAISRPNFQWRFWSWPHKKLNVCRMKVGNPFWL